MEEKIFLKKISKYAIQKTIILSSSLLIAAGGVLAGVGWTLFDLIQNENSVVPVILFSIYVIAIVFSIFAIMHYDKVRKKLIDEFGTNSLKEFFEYFTSDTKRSFAYYEAKDIFMYGLWKLKDNNPYLKQLSEIESTDFDDIEVVKAHINKKEFMASSIFRCLTFKKDDVIYRNQHIFLDQEKFLKIIDAYAHIYGDEKNHTKEYIVKCREIEKKYRKDKEYAKENYIGLAKKLGYKERFSNFSNNPKSVLTLKKALVVAAIIGMLLQIGATLETCIKKYENEINTFVTLLYNFITILLLLVDVAQLDEKKMLH